MKTVTDLEQSKKLVEILPIESADMYWSRCTITDFGDNILKVFYSVEPCNLSQFKNTDSDIPCWSLASLLEQLKSEIQLEKKQILFLHFNKYDDTDYEIRYTNSWTGEVLIAEADNPIDACYEMILKLHEQKLL